MTWLAVVRWSVAHQSSLITHDRRFLAVWQEIVVKFYLPPQPCRSSKIASKSAKSVFDFLRLARSWLKILAMSLMVCYRLWKWYVTALCNPSKLPKTICNHFRQPLMEMVCNRLSSYLPSYATAYRNGRQPLYAT